MDVRRDPLLILIAAWLLANAGLALPATRYWAAFVLLWLLPGLAWAGVLARGRRRVTAEDIAVGLGLGMGSVALLALLLSYLPGPLTFPESLAAVDVLLLVLCLLSARRLALGLQAGSRLSLGFFVLLVLLTASLRLVHLGYSEFQGDEAIVMMRAGHAILGDGAQLFYHQKGPVEILLPLATWALSGTIDEGQARLPFAFASILGVVSLTLLGRRWFSGRSAFIGALLLAINGYFVGFGRVVQYQSVVLAATTLALLALWRWAEEEGERWLFIGAGLLAFGLLAHYDAVLAAPAALMIAGRRLWRARRQWRTWWGSAIGAGALACGILGLFYVPFALHPNFAKTVGYLGGARLGTAGPLYNNLSSSLPLGLFYNSAYYLVVLACLLGVALFLSFGRREWLIPGVGVLLLLLQFLVPGLESSNWAGPVLAGLLAALLLSRRSSPSSRAAWLWFGVPFLFTYFLVWDPRTHVLNVFPAAVLLAGWVLDALLALLSGRVPVRARRWAGAAGYGLLGTAFFLLAAYPTLMFVQHDPEIKRTWPAHRPALYWRPVDETPLFGYFGFPYRAGWKVIGRLIDEGVLDGVIASNEEPEITSWYARGAERTTCPGPDWILIARDVQDEVPRQTPEEAAYALWGEVRVADEPKLWIYRRGAPPSAPAVYRVEDYEAAFDARSVPASLVPRAPEATPAGYTLGGMIRLLGYRLEPANARPGGSIRLVLYWEALQPIGASYQVFNHLYDGTMWGQQDGTPGCAIQPTLVWEPGRVVRDEYTIPIDPAAPAREIPLLVGMYSLEAGERLEVRDARGVPIGDAIPLAVVTVE